MEKINETELKKQIVNFLNDKRLNELESKIDVFNPFKVLRIDEFEIRHSNMLAWLFNPFRNHELGDIFLKKFLLKLFEKNTENLDIKDIYNVKQVDVFREKHNIDILILTDKLVILIENKIRSKQAENQLKKYREEIEKRHHDKKIICTFLTLRNETAEDERFSEMNYNEIIEIIEQIVLIKKEVMNQKVLDFITQYKDILEEKSLKNDKLQELSATIYREHKEAIDFITNNIKKGFNNLETQFRKDIIEERKSSWGYWFKKKDLVLNKEIDNWQTTSPASAWFSSGEDSITLYFEVGPIKNYKHRMALIKNIEEEFSKSGSKALFNKAAKRENAKYSRFFSDKEKIKDWSDEEEVKEKMNKLFEKNEKKIDLLNRIINETVWE